MARLYRPHVPLKVQCAVAMRQLGMNADEARRVAKGFNRRCGVLLPALLWKLAVDLGVDPASRLQLDHDPPLAARQHKLLKVDGRQTTVYVPDANDPDHLVWRCPVAHRVKTLIRGEHGQYSDIALIKRERRRKRKRTRPKKKIAARKKPWPKRKFTKRRKP